jgi:hypothetical protein
VLDFSYRIASTVFYFILNSAVRYRSRVGIVTTLLAEISPMCQAVQSYVTHYGSGGFGTFSVTDQGTKVHWPTSSTIQEVHIPFKSPLFRFLESRVAAIVSLAWKSIPLDEKEWPRSISRSLVTPLHSHSYPNPVRPHNHSQSGPISP